MVDTLFSQLPPAPYLILFSPLAACALITFFFLNRPKIAAFVALGGILHSLVWSAAMFSFQTSTTFGPAHDSYRWLEIAGFQVDFGYYIDPMALLMLLIVSGVGSCIFLYSIAYMKGDSSYGRYFASLSLFAFSMLGIVIADNFFMLFVFWELVAVSSYLLIGFWFEKPSAADAGNKAFIVNRVADFGLVLGIFSVWALSGLGGEARTFNIHALSERIPALLASGGITQTAMIAAALLVFCGVVGKSAQFPLYIWLPDAMEGPTPVSALIHAATMVAAGVYLMSRSFFLVQSSPEALIVIASIGALTAFLAALLALVQNDIKKVLAYSTISQLGYMVLALGLGSSTAAMYHLATHAFFKAMLFLGAGAMIHALHTQDIWEMGGLIKPMPVVSVTFIIGTLALCGIWPLSGFFSKDEILALAFEHNKLLFAAALLTAGLTAFYMSRAVWVAVLGPSKVKKHGHQSSHSLHDAPMAMKLPLVILAALSIVAGFIGIPAFIMGGHGHPEKINILVAVISSAVALAGLGFGTYLYKDQRSKNDPAQKALGAFYNVIVEKFYLDAFFSALANLFQKNAASALLWFDLNIVIRDGVNGAAKLTAGVGALVRRVQTGSVRNYALLFGSGVIALLFFFMRRG